MVPKISEQCRAGSPESQLPRLGQSSLPKPCSLPGQGQQSVGRWHWESVPSADVGSSLASSQVFPSGVAITLPDLEFAIWWPRPIGRQPQARLLRRPAVS